MKVPMFCKYSPLEVLENNLARLCWDREILTDKTVPLNCPDITLFEKTNKIV